MKPTRYLRSIRVKSTVRLLKIKDLAAEATNQSPPDLDKIISYVTIECLNTWRNFSRSYFLSCTLFPWREGGSQITLSNRTIQTYDDALNVAMRICKPGIWRRGDWSEKDEPAWHYPGTFIKCCDEIGCSNLTEILNAFSIQTRVFDFLPLFRNFYAHRGRYTARIAKNVAPRYSIHMHNHPTNILCTAAYGRPQILLLDWIDDIKITMELLCL